MKELRGAVDSKSSRSSRTWGVARRRDVDDRRGNARVEVLRRGW